MDILKYILRVVLIVVILASPAISATHYVSSDGSGTWANSTSIDTPCSLATANSNATAGDVVYLRAGTYTVTGDAISPAHSGTSGNVIEYSAYTSDGGSTFETVTITGASGLTGHGSRGIYLYGDSYIKITRIIFTNLYLYLWLDNGASHNEISYCTFQNMRDVYSDVIESGTATNTDNSTTILQDTSKSWSPANLYNNRQVVNSTDKSIVYSTSASDDTTISHPSYPLRGGTNNYWSTGDSYNIIYGVYYGISYIKTNSNYNWVHHNTFHHMGLYNAAQDGGVALQVGVEDPSTDMVQYNTIENNTLYSAGHHVLGVNNCKYCIIRNNTIRNEAWYTGDLGGVCATRPGGGCGYRVVSCAGVSGYSGWSLFEGNRIGYGAQGGHHITEGGLTGGSGSGTTLSIPNNIYRYNDHINNAEYGLRFAASVGANGANNRVYNNTFYKNGYGGDSDPLTADDYRGGINFYASSCSQVFGEVIKNNLLYDNWASTNKTTTTYYPAIYAKNSTVRDSCSPANVISNNYADSSATFLGAAIIHTQTDPKFTDPDITTPSNIATKPDLTLQAASPAIDGGTYLTQANGSGTTSTTLIVDDASYFQDGTWGSDLASLGADVIAVGTVGNVAQISSINYSTNTITLATPLTWSDNANIWLYKKSDGTQVLYDTAPDYGAHEYSGGSSPVTTYTITYSVSGSGCSWTAGTGTVSGGSTISQTLTITDGYKGTVDKGTCDGGSCVRKTATTTHSHTPTGDETVSATCEQRNYIRAR